MTLSLYEADINQIPATLQNFLPIYENLNWYESYRQKFPRANDQLLFITQPTKARLLGQLETPLTLKESIDDRIDGDKFIFIADQNWVPESGQRLVSKDNAKRIRIKIVDKTIDSIEELPLGIEPTVEPLEPMSQSTPAVKTTRPSRSLERTSQEQRNEEKQHQQWRIQELKKQVAREEIARIKQKEEFDTMQKKLQEMELENSQVSPQTLAIIQDQRQQLEQRELELVEHQDEIMKLENTIRNLSLLAGNEGRPFERNIQKKPTINVGKIQVPIYDEATSDIHETLDRLDIVLSFAENNPDLVRTIIYNFLQKNNWESMINSNPKILDDVHILRDELIQRHDPEKDSTEQYINLSQRPAEDEKDYMGRLERGYRIFMKIKPNALLTKQQQDAIKSRFVATLTRKDVRVYMKGHVEDLDFNQIADRARKFRRVVETEDENKVLLSTENPRSKEEKMETSNEQKVCKFCRLPHDSSECHASDKFKRKSNKRYFPPSKQSFTIPQEKLRSNVRFDSKFPTAEPGQNDSEFNSEDRGRSRYRDRYYERRTSNFRNQSSERRPYNNYDRSRSRDYRKNINRQNTRGFRPRINRYSGQRRRFDQSWPPRNQQGNRYRRNSSWNSNGNTRRPTRDQPTRLVNISQSMNEHEVQSILKAPVEDEAHEFLY